MDTSGALRFSAVTHLLTGPNKVKMNFERGANGYGPTNVSFTFVEDRPEVNIRIRFVGSTEVGP